MKYRWLETSKTYKYSARSELDERRGQPCLLLAVPRAGAIGNVLVQFLDGVKVICSAGVLRKLEVA